MSIVASSAFNKERREWILNTRLSLFVFMVGKKPPQLSQTAWQIPRKNSFSFPCLIIFFFLLLDETENDFSHAIAFLSFFCLVQNILAAAVLNVKFSESTKHDIRFMNFR